MRVLIIIGSFKMGGAERMSINTGEELLKRGYDVYFVVQRPIFEIPHSISQDRIFTLRDLDRTDLFYKISSLLWGVFKVSKKIDPDVIIGFTRFSSFLANFTFHSKIIARFDAYPFRMNRKQRLWANFIIKSPLIKKIVVPSTDMMNALKEEPKGEDKYTLIPNSINATAVLERAEIEVPFYNFKYISAMGRFSPQKNFQLLIKAYAKSKLSDKNKLVIIGDGGYKSRLKTLVEKLNLSGQVIFTGNLKNPFPVIKKSLFFVNPSKFESFGNVIVEALTLGKPVIATDCNFGPADIVVHNENGFLVKDNSMENLVEKLNLLGQDEELIRKLGINASNSVGKFYLKNIGSKWEELIRAI